MNDTVLVLVGIGLFIASAFFVAAEYSLVSVRRSKVEAKAKKGVVAAKRVIHALDQQTRYVAGTQIAITFLGIAVGAVLEPDINSRIVKLLPANLPSWAVNIIAILIISYPLVVLGELVPKYIALKFPERVAMAVVRPLQFVVLAFQPLIWLFQKSGYSVLRLIGIDPHKDEAVLSKEELTFLVRESQTDGEIEEPHADVINRALRLDRLDANDVMVHRLDVKWLASGSTQAEIMAKVADIPHSRIPVCKDDIDDIAGIVYLQDIVKHIHNPHFTLEWITRPAEFVPENLSLDRVISRMREAKTQILIVRDEYGGTSGLLTIEDVMEEIFGDLEDALESDRSPIERTSGYRLSAKGDVRYDEIVAFLGDTPDEDTPTQTLSTILVEHVDRTPKLGDTVDVPLGKLRVDHITRHRIVRVGVYLNRKGPKKAPIEQVAR